MEYRISIKISIHIVIEILFNKMCLSEYLLKIIECLKKKKKSLHFSTLIFCTSIALLHDVLSIFA